MKQKRLGQLLFTTLTFNVLLVGYTCYVAPVILPLKLIGLVTFNVTALLWGRQHPLHLQTLLALALSLLSTGLISTLGIPYAYINAYLAPFGKLMLNNLMVMAMPIMAVSIMVSIIHLGGASNMSRMGMTSLGLYTLTTWLAIGLGVGLGVIIGPGHRISAHAQSVLQSLSRHQSAEQGGLWFLLRCVPHPFSAKMIPTIMATVVLSIGIIRTPSTVRAPLEKVIKAFHEALIHVMRLLMQMVPLGTFALVTNLLAGITMHDGLSALVIIGKGLFWYVGTVLLGLAILNWVVYPMLLLAFTPISYTHFVKATQAPQLLAFSTGSSMATLPLTIATTERVLGVPASISQFVLPLGASINMDGTALYQTVALLFLSQISGVPFSWASCVTLMIQVFIASIGAAPVAGGAVVSTRYMLKELNIPGEITLLMVPDRLLEMCRTVTNITGDMAVTALVAHWEQKKTVSKKIQQ